MPALSHGKGPIFETDSWVVVGDPHEIDSIAGNDDEISTNGGSGDAAVVRANPMNALWPA